MQDLRLAELKAGVCFIEVENSHPVDIEHSGNWTGTGFLISELGNHCHLIATCAHVAPLSSKKVTLEFSNGFRTKGKVVYMDHAHDLSFIEFEDLKGKVEAKEFEFENDVKEFENVTIIGGNEGFKSYVATGMVANRQIQIGDRNTDGIQSNIPAAGGTSGSPVFNQHGKIVGMHTSGTEKCSFSMKSIIILDALERFLNSRPKQESGISFKYDNKFNFLEANLITENECDLIFNNSSQLLVVKDIDPIYDAFNKLLPGDLIISINNVHVSDMYSAEKIINDVSVGSCEILFKRNGIATKTNIEIKNANVEETNMVLDWSLGTFQNTNIRLRRYYCIANEGVLLSKAFSGSCFSDVGGTSSRYANGKGALITHVNGIRVNNLKQFMELVLSTKSPMINLTFSDHLVGNPSSYMLVQVEYTDFKIRNFKMNQETENLVLTKNILDFANVIA